ncbi:hypothetical protein MKW92_053368 [Papaver armeniacum]|nr:hypothetical protein MKW92_053368 [Papaver armeniacum]
MKFSKSMTPTSDFCLPHEFFDDDDEDEEEIVMECKEEKVSNLLDMSHSIMAFYPISAYLSILDNNNCLFSSSYGSPKLDTSLISLPRLQFRDHISTYKDRFFLALKPSKKADCNDWKRCVACRDRCHASALLSELRNNAKIFGTCFQFLLVSFKALLILRPCLSDMSTYFGHFVANLSILEAFEGESFVHVVDLGMTVGLQYGLQWYRLINSLVNRVLGFPPREELQVYARSLGLNFEFSLVESNLENLKKEDFNLYEGGVVIVKSILQLHCVVKESRGALNSVLQVIHELSPKVLVLVLVEQDSSHNGPFFLGRFMEALHYYSAIFDSLDTMLPKYDTKRAKIEQFYFAEEIKNIVRHVKSQQELNDMERLIGGAKQWLEKLNVCEGYTIMEEKGCLVLGWQSKSIVMTSCWKSLNQTYRTA